MEKENKIVGGDLIMDAVTFVIAYVLGVLTVFGLEPFANWAKDKPIRWFRKHALRRY